MPPNTTDGESDPPATGVTLIVPWSSAFALGGITPPLGAVSYVVMITSSLSPAFGTGAGTSNVHEREPFAPAAHSGDDALTSYAALPTGVLCVASL